VQTSPEYGRTVYVDPGSVLRTILRRGNVDVGVTFRYTNGEVTEDLLSGRTSGPTDTFVRPQQHRDGFDFNRAIMRNEGATRVPWAGDYRHGRSGPFYLLAHGLPDWFVGMVRAGAAVWDGQLARLGADMQSNLSGASALRLLRGIQGFNDRLADGAGIAGIMCLVGSGRWSDAFVTAMRNEGFTNEAHFANDVVYAGEYQGRFYVSVVNNAGYDTYPSPHNGGPGRVPAPHTRVRRQPGWDDERERLRRRFDP
jgi:hypothetical protein